MPSGATLTARAPKMRGLARRAAVAAMLGDAGAGEGVDDPAREIDDPHPVVGDIGDIEARLVGIEGEPVRLGETRLRRRAAVAGIGRLAGAGQRRDDAGVRRRCGARGG